MGGRGWIACLSCLDFISCYLIINTDWLISVSVETIKKKLIYKYKEGLIAKITVCRSYFQLE